MLITFTEIWLTIYNTMQNLADTLYQEFEILGHTFTLGSAIFGVGLLTIISVMIVKWVL